MQKTLIYIVLLAVLGFGVYYFVFRSNSPYSNKEAGFNVKDTASIGRIFISQPGNGNILLERTDSGWIVNKKYKVLQSTLNVLLGTMAEQEPLYPVPESAHNNVIKIMSGNGIKVELYDRKGEQMRVFYVGGEAAGKEGTYMLMDGASRPYVVQIQNFNGYLTPRYTPFLKDWRDRGIFRFQPQDIKRVEMTYYDHPLNSFVITQDNGKIDVTGDKQVISGSDTLNVRRAKVYLGYFKDVSCEGYITDDPTMDSVLKSVPKQSMIDVTAQDGRHQHVDIYWMPVNRRSKNLTETSNDVPDQYDADRFFAVINDGRDTVMIQRFVFRPIFRRAFEFYQKDVQGKQEESNKRAPNVIIHKEG